MALVVLSDIHSSSGNEKKVRQVSRELDKDFTAEGSSFSHLAAKASANASAFVRDDA